MHVARGVPCAKVFSAKSSFTPIRESFLPRKIPAIRYVDVSGRKSRPEMEGLEEMCSILSEQLIFTILELTSEY